MNQLKTIQEWHEIFSQEVKTLEINPLTGKAYRFGEKERIITIDSFSNTKPIIKQ